MKILALDIATSTGWAVYDTDKTPSAIECGVFDLSVAEKGVKKTGVEKRRLMRGMIDAEICRLIDRYRPGTACLEQPLNYIKPQGQGKPKKAPLFKGDVDPHPKTDKEEKGGPNADTVLMLNQLFAVAYTICAHKCQLMLPIEVAPTSWQVLTKAHRGDTKERSISYCHQLKVILPPELNKKERGDAADAVCIAVWAAGQIQKDKMMDRAA